MTKLLYGGGEYYYLSGTGNFEETHNYHLQFRDHMLVEPGLKGEVLDIGCGDDIPATLVGICSICKAIDGVDPDPAVMGNPRLRQRWNMPLEEAPIADSQYDLAQPREFFRHVRRVLKPGGVFWAVTPHCRHPFTWLARGAELAGLKAGFHRRDPGVNSYSSYYRANSRRQVLRAIEGLGFKTARFYYHPAGWRQYFPRGMRWAGDVYDRLWGRRVLRRMLEFSFRLEAEG
jgi:SAM-dependent methyltransferase